MTATDVPRRSPASMSDKPDAKGRRIIELDDGRLVRVSADMGRLWSVIDGESTMAQLASVLGDPWTPELVQFGIAQLSSSGLIEDEAQIRRRQASDVGGAVKTIVGAMTMATAGSAMPAAVNPPRRRRLTMAANGSIQWTLFSDIERYRAVRAISGIAGSRAFLGVLTLIGAVGLVVLAVDWPGLVSALTQRVSVWQIVAVFALFAVATSMHEFGHAARAIRAGGRVRRVGLMLLYLVPAFFCDISDTWRLPERDRVGAALAGPVVSAGLAGVSAFVFLGIGSPTCGLLALFLYLECLIGLIPLVKFDGYIAVMGHLDHPNLRKEAMQAWKLSVARVLSGKTAFSDVKQDNDDIPAQRVPGWMNWYGFGCSVFPLILVGGVVMSMGASFTALGSSGIVLRALLIACVIVFAGVGVVSTLLVLHRAGVSVLRLCGVSVVFLAVVGAVAMVIPVRQDTDGAYYASQDGQIYVCFPGGAALAQPVGTDVHLRVQGLLLGRSTGQGRIASDPVTAQVPTTINAPSLKWSGPMTWMSVQNLDLTGGDVEPGSVGVARVPGSDMPALQWLWKVVIMDPYALVKAI